MARVLLVVDGLLSPCAFFHYLFVAIFPCGLPRIEQLRFPQRIFDRAGRCRSCEPLFPHQKMLQVKMFFCIVVSHRAPRRLLSKHSLSKLFQVVGWFHVFAKIIPTRDWKTPLPENQTYCKCLFHPSRHFVFHIPTGGCTGHPIHTSYQSNTWRGHLRHESDLSD